MMRLLLELFWSFFKIGAFTFGSGYAMIPMIEKEVVDRKKWFAKDDFYDHFVLAQSAPGPIALNTAVFVGYRIAGWPGALSAVLGTAVPPFAIILLIACFLTGFRDNPYVESAFKGIRPAVIALIAVPFVKMLLRLKWYFIILALAVAAGICYLGLSPVWLIACAIAVGVISTYFKK